MIGEGVRDNTAHTYIRTRRQTAAIDSAGESESDYDIRYDSRLQNNSWLM